MKRLWLVLLSLGLIVAFSTSAMAVDVKFSGEFYAAGVYVDKGEMVKNNIWTTGAEAANTSSAFYYQRLRLNTTFVVHPGLMLITRADIMERVWGNVVRAPLTNTTDVMSAGTRAENENIAFDLLYAMYISPIGVFTAGYQIDNAWGTVFGDTSLPTGKITYMFRGGPIMIGLQTGKNTDNSRNALNNTIKVDRDSSFYTAWISYNWKGGDAGFLTKYIRNAIPRGTPGDTLAPTFLEDLGVKADVWVFIPYVKAQLGPVALQAEFYYLWGKQTWEGVHDLIGRPDHQNMNQMTGWIDATGDFGMFYVGGTFAYVSGDDPATDQAEGGTLSGGLDWKPCLILWNSDMTYWTRMARGYDGTTTAGPMNNAYFLQARAGVRPVEKLDIMASVSWAHADKTLSAQWNSRDIGYEIDLTATYKITNNLSYMLGGGYLIAGDWFKGTDIAGFAEPQNNFLVLNKLTLTF